MQVPCQAKNSAQQNRHTMDCPKKAKRTIRITTLATLEMAVVAEASL